MSFRFFRRSKPIFYKGIADDSMVLPSAEAAWPLRGPGPTVEQNLEFIEFAHRVRAQARAQQEQQD
jgi:hypothetical protein